MVKIYDHRSVFFEYSKLFDDIPTEIKILSTPTDLCIFVSQEKSLSRNDITFKNEDQKDFYLFSNDLYNYLRSKKIVRDKKLLVFCIAKDITEISKELEMVLKGKIKLSEMNC